MNPLTEKVLQSGLIDKAMVEMMEKMGFLPEGASDKVKEDALKNAPLASLHKLADEMAYLLEKEHELRETHLGLKTLKWPAVISVEDKGGSVIVKYLQCMMDEMGRYYVRFADVKKEWFIPGYILTRMNGKQGEHTREEITEVQPLFIDDKPICYQVSVNSDRFVTP